MQHLFSCDSSGLKPYLCRKYHAMSDETLRKPGEMFTASALKKATPIRQFIFVSIVGLICLLTAKYILHSQDLIMYGGCFGVILYIMFNPWLCLLTDNNKKYIITSFILYPVITVLMYSIVYLWTGKYVENSWEIRIILITASFYLVVAYGMMMGLKMLFLDLSDGGL
jgi:apolipoprotein N-acyltransferase